MSFETVEEILAYESPFVDPPEVKVLRSCCLGGVPMIRERYGQHLSRDEALDLMFNLRDKHWDECHRNKIYAMVGDRWKVIAERKWLGVTADNNQKVEWSEWEYKD